jgi:hypothetical protein
MIVQCLTATVIAVTTANATIQLVNVPATQVSRVYFARKRLALITAQDMVFAQILDFAYVILVTLLKIAV